MTGLGRQQRLAALRSVRADVLSFCSDIEPEEWGLPSMAPGWTIHDVIAHLGAGCHSLFSLDVLRLIRSDAIERTNDDFVADRRAWTPERTLAEYETWSHRLVGLAAVVVGGPLRRVPMPLAELGFFPANVMIPGALVFDAHTHLRFDIAPVLNRDPTPTDEAQMAVSLEWMMAVLGNQIRSGHFAGLDAPITLELLGAGGGTWTLGPHGIRAGADEHVAATVTGDVSKFPGWGTQRTPWRDEDLEVSGDVDVVAAILDQLNVV